MRWPRWAPALPLALAVLAQLAFSHRVGFVTGDDVEVLETALMPAGLAYQPLPTRNLLPPRLLVSPILLAARALGVADPLDLARLAVLPFLALTLCTALLVHRLARRLCDERVAAVAAGVFALHWLPLFYGGTVYPRTASTLCIVLAALLLTGRGSGAAGGDLARGPSAGDQPARRGKAGDQPARRGNAGSDLARGLAAGALVSLGCAERYSEAIFLAPLGLDVLLGRSGAAARRRRLAGVGLGFAGGAALAWGASDAWFWGSPFASLVAFARYLGGAPVAPRLSAEPALWYLRNAWIWLPPTLLPFLYLAARRAHWRAGLRLPWLAVTLPVLLLSAVQHKELRYLQGIVPFLAILVAAGVVEAWDGRPATAGHVRPGDSREQAARPPWPAWRRRGAVAALLGASLLLSLLTVRTLLRGKTVDAVDAALTLHGRPGLRTVALAKAWSYGDHLFLGNGVTILAMASPPRPPEARAALAAADAIGVFAADLPRAPALAAAVRQAAPGEVTWFRSWHDQPVVVLQRRRR